MGDKKDLSKEEELKKEESYYSNIPTSNNYNNKSQHAQ